MRDWSPEDLQKHLDAGDKVFLKLWKKGCGACKLSIPAIERIEAADAEGMVFGQICTDDHPEILEIAETDVLPVFFVFADKKMRGQMEGFKGLERLKSMVDDALKAGE
jgi:thioredoxin-like negative regulator of GroEL